MARNWKKWPEENPEKFKAIQWKSHLKRKFGITPQEYDEIFTAQNGVCGICERRCKTWGSLSVDHNHTTGKVRGLLCNACNNGLGRFGDDYKLLERAANWVRSIDD